MCTKHFRLSVLTLGLAAAFSATAQTSDAERLKALEAKFGQSMAVIEQLQKRIGELEQGKAGATSPAASAVVNRVETLEKSVTELATSASKTSTDVGLPLHGFLDTGYASASGKPPAYEKSGFRLGTFDIYLTPQFSDRVKGLVELAFEYGADGGLGTDLERLQLGYVVNDNLTLWAGRFHTPYGYWNTAFHHGAQIQTSITRPRMIAFEDQGGILPSHTVGAWATGKFDTGVGRLNYDVFAGNSDSMRDGTLDYNASGYNNGTPAMGFNLGLSPKAVPGLTVGLHAVSEKINSYDALDTLNGETTMQVAGAYAFYESDNLELIAEYYNFNNQDHFGKTGTHNSTAGFVQAGYQVANRLTAFARYEKADLNQADPYFNLMNLGATQFGKSYHQSTVGLRYDLDPRSALKLQLEQITDEGNANQTVNWLRAQYSVRF
ncbi:MAG: hypothetical protein WCH60_19780 [Burkholderiales bacterium]